MAVLGALCADGVPISLPQVTGCRAAAPVAGTWILPPPPASARSRRRAACAGTQFDPQLAATFLTLDLSGYDAMVEAHRGLELEAA